MKYRAVAAAALLAIAFWPVPGTGARPCHACAQAAPASVPSPPPKAPAEGENAPDDAPPLPVPPVPPRISENGQYERCMDMLADDPSGADALAVGWADGGEPARHCHALAQIALGNPAAGAGLLVSLADNAATEPEARASLYGQAAQAWTMAGDAARAYQAASSSIALAPEDPDLRVTHAIAALGVHRPEAALDDTSVALESDPKRADAYVLRATAERMLGKLKDADVDIARACDLDPDNADALLERGIIRQRLGDLNGARGDWEKVSGLSPDTPDADMAEQDLALLEAGPDQ